MPKKADKERQEPSAEGLNGNGLSRSRSPHTYITASCEPIRPASALDLESHFAQLKKEQKDVKDALTAWQARQAEQLRAHRLALERLVVEQTAEQARTLEKMASRLEELMQQQAQQAQQRSNERRGLEAEMEAADRLEVSVLGLHRRHEERLKEIEETHSLMLSKHHEKLSKHHEKLLATAPSPGIQPRGNPAMPDGAAEAPSPAPPTSASVPEPGAECNRSFSFQVHPPPVQPPSNSDLEEPEKAGMEMPDKASQVKQAMELPSANSSPPSFGDSRAEAAGNQLVSLQVQQPLGSNMVEHMTDKSTPVQPTSSSAHPHPTKRKNSLSWDCGHDDLCMGSKSHAALLSRKGSTIHAAQELDTLANTYPEGSCWHSFYTGSARFVRWWYTLREPERHGFLANIVRSKYFHALSFAFIALDATMTAYAANYEMEHFAADRSSTIIILEMTILAFYVIEIFLKLLLHRAFFFLAEDWRWNVTDLLVVVNSGLTLSGFNSDLDFSFLRVCRVFRITRIFLLFREVGFVKQLQIMMDCVLNCFLNLFWCIVLVIFVSFIFALFLVQHMTQYLISDASLNEDFEEEKENIITHFGSVQLTLLTLFKVVSGGDDWAFFYNMVEPTGGLGPPLFLFFIAFFVIAVWNIITSLFMEVAMARVRPTSRDLIVEKHQQDIADVEELSQIFSSIDTDESEFISREEFLLFLENPEAMEALQVRGLDIKDKEAFFEMLTSIDAREHKVGLEEFVDGCLKMRGPASSLDLHNVKFEMALMRRTMMRVLRAVADRLEGIEKVVGGAPER